MEVEEKYRKAMVSNAQLHNEKTTLMYQVETLKEELSDMEELLWESRRHCDDTSRVRGHTGVTMRSYWGHSGVTLGSHWGHSGVILGSHWGHTYIHHDT